MLGGSHERTCPWVLARLGVADPSPFKSGHGRPITTSSGRQRTCRRERDGLDHLPVTLRNVPEVPVCGSVDPWRARRSRRPSKDAMRALPSG